MAEKVHCVLRQHGRQTRIISSAFADNEAVMSVTKAWNRMTKRYVFVNHHAHLPFSRYLNQASLSPDALASVSKSGFNHQET